MNAHRGFVLALSMAAVLGLFGSTPLLAANEYQIDLTVDPTKGTLRGVQKVVYRNETQAPLDSLTLEAPGLPGNPPIPGNERWRITALVDTKGNNVPLTWNAGEEAYTAPLSPPLGAGFKTNFTMQFERPVSAAETAAGYLSLHDRGAGTWYLKFRAYRAGSFGSDDLKDVTVNLALPAGWAVASTGVAPAKSGSGGKVTLSAKGVRNFALAFSDRFRMVKGTAGAIPVLAFSLEGKEAWGKQVLSEAAEAVNYYTAFLGSYPVAQVTVLPAETGSESSTNVIYAPPSDNPDLLREAIGYEAARLVWGWTVGDPSDATPFIANGLAAWCQQSYLAKKNGLDFNDQFSRSGINDAYLSGVLRGYDTTLLRTKAERAKLDWDFDRVVAKAKSAAVMHMLGNLIGEDKLQGVLLGMLKPDQPRVLTDREFQATVQAATPARLDGFFEQWLRTKNSLDYYLSHLRVVKTATGYEAHADVWKTGTAAMPVEVVVEDITGARVRSIFPADRSSGEMAIPIKAPLAAIRLDPRQILPLISRVGIAGRLDLAEGLLAEGKLLRADEQIDRALSDAPQHPRALFLKGRVLKERGDWAGALALWAKGMAPAPPAPPTSGSPPPPPPVPTDDPARIWAQIWTARIYDLQGKRSEATALYTAVTALPDARGSRAAAKAGLEKPFEDVWPPLVP